MFPGAETDQPTACTASVLSGAILSGPLRSRAAPVSRSIQGPGSGSSISQQTACGLWFVISTSNPPGPVKHIAIGIPLALKPEIRGPGILLGRLFQHPAEDVLLTCFKPHITGLLILFWSSLTFQRPAQ